MSVIYDYGAELWREFKAEFTVELQAHYDAAAAATGGELLSDHGKSAETHPWQLFVSGPEFSGKHASAQLKEFWKDNPRPVSAQREREWLSERLGKEAPGLVANSDSAIFSWASSVWRRCRSEYDVELEARFNEAEAATNGNMVNKRGRAMGVRSWDLMGRSSGFVRAYGSEELADYWRGTPRMTFAVFEDSWFGDFVHSDGEQEQDTLAMDLEDASYWSAKSDKTPVFQERRHN